MYPMYNSRVRYGGITSNLAYNEILAGHRDLQRCREIVCLNRAKPCYDAVARSKSINCGIAPENSGLIVYTNG